MLLCVLALDVCAGSSCCLGSELNVEVSGSDSFCSAQGLRRLICRRGHVQATDLIP